MCVTVIRLCESQTTHFIADAILSKGSEFPGVIKYFRANWYNPGLADQWEF